MTTDQFDGAFTVDVEDYFQVAAFETLVRPERWDDFESRVVGNTQRILNILERRQVRATFFVLGWVAERHPQLVRQIHERGHEIGSHGYWHRRIYTQTPDEFRCDLRRSRDVLSGIIGQPVRCYRAPTFSITAKSRWALQILVEEGFEIDSSIVPARHDRYGMPGAQRGIHRLDTPAGPLWEFPPTVARFGPYHLPAGGGGYFRLYPFRFSRYCLSHARRETGQPLMFYVHPWEIDPQQPRFHNASRLSRFRHYVNLHSTERKLDRLLQTFRFGTVGELVPVRSSSLPRTNDE
jgi:polysaccharide deacetylase family protein (PEP-CTERM system associated)